MRENSTESAGFSDLSAEDLKSYLHQKSAEIGLAVPGEFLPSVLETLAALQAHAAIVSARLEDSQKQPVRNAAS